jgi:hypothetical protein
MTSEKCIQDKQKLFNNDRYREAANGLTGGSGRPSSGVCACSSGSGHVNPDGIRSTTGYIACQVNRTHILLHRGTGVVTDIRFISQPRVCASILDLPVGIKIRARGELGVGRG